MPRTPTREIVVLGLRRTVPATIAERMVREGRAQFAEVAGFTEPETATVEAPERAVKPAPAAKTGTKAKRKTKRSSERKE
ncbi:MAG: hypothetical protein AMS19_02685 [Gemmatimonas sp. SG8_23]|jgi:hypothetical protein|nr:MAG: hypothetical protein AMS19_02685 [Gemmatimonas sp. SG8_23]